MNDKPTVSQTTQIDDTIRVLALAICVEPSPNSPAEPCADPCPCCLREASVLFEALKGEIHG